MKKLTLTLALILCLVLCAFCFASCAKKDKTAATTAAPTAPATTATPTEPATEEETGPVCNHVPEDEFFIETAATCIAAGSKVKLCAECGEPIEETREVIPVDPNAHKVIEWVTDVPTLLKPVGSETGTCTLCEQEINNELHWELEVYDSMDPSGKYMDGNAFRYNKKFGDIRGDKSFAPTEDDPDGNDLWFEYSFLWNDSLQYRDNPSNLAEIRIFGFRDTNDWSNYRGFYYLYLLDDDDKGGAFHTSGDCPWKGHIDFSTYYPGSKPGQNCAIDLTSEGNTLNGKPIGRYIAGWGAGRDDSPYLYDDNYQTLGGWHRLGYRYHQEAEIVDGEVRYSGYTELYIDGVKCWKVLSNMEGLKKDNGTWSDTDWSLKGKNLLLWTAEIDENDPTKLIYTNNDTVAVEFRIDNITSSSQSVYICVDDFQATCGDGFAVDVVRVENPTETTITLAEGVTASGAMYFAAAAAD